jgi:hypothetical protein
MVDVLEKWITFTSWCRRKRVVLNSIFFSLLMIAGLMPVEGLIYAVAVAISPGVAFIGGAAYFAVYVLGACLTLNTITHSERGQRIAHGFGSRFLRLMAKLKRLTRKSIFGVFLFVPLALMILLNTIGKGIMRFVLFLQANQDGGRKRYIFIAVYYVLMLVLATLPGFIKIAVWAYPLYPRKSILIAILTGTTIRAYLCAYAYGWFEQHFDGSEIHSEPLFLYLSFQTPRLRSGNFCVDKTTGEVVAGKFDRFKSVSFAGIFFF